MLRAFWSQPVPAYRNFQIVFTALTANFLFPSLSYLFTPDAALAQVDSLCATFGWAPISPGEAASQLWRFLAFSNVLALAFLCALLQANLRRWHPALLPLMVLKAGSSFGAGWVFLQTGHPFFALVVVFDGLTVAAMGWFATRARAAIEGVADERLVPRPRFTLAPGRWR